MKYFPEFEKTEDSVRFLHRGRWGCLGLAVVFGGLIMTMSRPMRSFFQMDHSVVKNQDPLPQGIVIMFGVVAISVLLLIVGVTVGAALWAIFGRTEGELKKDGFHYRFRVLIPLKRYFIPLEEIVCFDYAGEEVPGKNRSDSLKMHVLAASGTLPLISCLVVEDEVAEVVKLVQDLNDVVVALQSQHVAADLVEELGELYEWRAESVSREDAWDDAEKTPRPEWSAWVVDSDMETLIFRRKTGFSLLVNFFAAIIAVLGGFVTAFVLVTVVPVMIQAGVAAPVTWLMAVCAGLMLWIGVGLMYYAAVHVSDFGRWEYFGKRGAFFCHGHSVFGKRVEKKLPWEAWYCVDFDDTGEDATLPLTLLFEERRTVPSYYLELRDPEKASLLKMEGLTRDEARWMRDALMALR